MFYIITYLQFIIWKSRGPWLIGYNSKNLIQISGSENHKKIFIYHYCLVAPIPDVNLLLEITIEEQK